MLKVQTAQPRDSHPQIAVIPSISPRESTGPGQAMVGQSPSPKKCSILCNMSVCVCVLHTHMDPHIHTCTPTDPQNLLCITPLLRFYTSSSICR